MLALTLISPCFQSTVTSVSTSDGELRVSHKVGAVVVAVVSSYCCCCCRSGQCCRCPATALQAWAGSAWWRLQWWWWLQGSRRRATDSCSAAAATRRSTRVRTRGHVLPRPRARWSSARWTWVWSVNTTEECRAVWCCRKIFKWTPSQKCEAPSNIQAEHACDASLPLSIKFLQRYRCWTRGSSYRSRVLPSRAPCLNPKAKTAKSKDTKSLIRCKRAIIMNHK